MSEMHDRPFPRGALWSAGILVALSIGAATTARLTGYGVHLPPAPVVRSMDLVFQDRADGAVQIRTPDGSEVAVLAPGTNGFVRGVLRGLARDRHARDLGKEVPFRLDLRQDGRLVLADPATGREIDLSAFGPTNKEAFARLIPGAAG